MQKGIVGCGLLLSLSLNVEALPLETIVTLGYASGGDNFNVQFDNGESSAVNFGGGLRFGGGVLYEVPDWPVEIQSSLSLYTSKVSASNGDISFWRTPLDLLAFYPYKSFRLGAGLTHHFHVQLEQDLSNDGTLVTYDNATGWLLEFSWRVPNSQWQLGTRYTGISYKSDSPEINNPSLNELDGSGIEINTSYRF